MILKIFSPKQLAFLTKNTVSKFFKLIITLVFLKNAEKMAHIAENNDHNIDPRLGNFVPGYDMSSCYSFTPM
jgi:hypothetical protein